MKRNSRVAITLLVTVALAILLLLCGAAAACAQESDQNWGKEPSKEAPEQAKQEAEKPDTKASAGDLAKAVQNPVASLISVPVQNVTDFNIGPYQRDRNTVLQFQPVIPMQLGQSWNLITRIIAPVIAQPDISQPHLSTFGLGDINPSFFLSPAQPGKLIWGAGPTFLIPTATDNSLGTGKFSLGPSVVALVQPAKWTLGVLVNNLWSVAGPSNRPDVNSMTLQYFINYNLRKGYYLTSQPVLSANWNAPSGNVWLVPFGGGVGRIMRLGFQPVNLSAQAYVNAKRPDVLPSPTWQLKFQIAFLYPKKPSHSEPAESLIKDKEIREKVRSCLRPDARKADHTKADHTKADHTYKRSEQNSRMGGWHAARRGLGSNLYRLGVPDMVIQRILRHANVSTTASYYIKTAADDVWKAMQKLETQISANSQALSDTDGTSTAQETAERPAIQ